MRTFKLLLSLPIFLSISALAETTLKVPIAVEGFKKKSLTSMEEINEVLKEKGLPAQPTHIVIKQHGNPDYLKMFGAMEKELAQAGLKDVSVISELFPNEHGQDGLVTCFTGRGTEVADVARAAVDEYYSDQMNIHGWRYGQKSWTADEDWTPEYLAQESKEWRTYDPASKTVLILTAVGDEGTDINVSEIERCR